MAAFSDLIGKTLVKIDGLERGSEHVTFVTATGERYVMWHLQDCCETVEVEDVAGEVADLIGSPILRAEEPRSDEWPMALPEPDYRDESFTWTSYKLATIKGSVDIRWYGSSNGYYSEDVAFTEV